MTGLTGTAQGFTRGQGPLWCHHRLPLGMGAPPGSLGRQGLLMQVDILASAFMCPGPANAETSRISIKRTHYLAHRGFRSGGEHDFFQDLLCARSCSS